MRGALGALLIAVAVVAAGCLQGSGKEQQADLPQVGALWRSAAQPELLAILGQDGMGRVDAPVLMHDLDGDGEVEVVVASADRNTHIFSISGTPLATLPSHYPPSWHVESVLNAPVAGTLHPGEATSLVLANPSGIITAWTYAPVDGEFSMQQTWEIRLNGCHASPGLDAAPTLADGDGDGGLEIYVQAEQMGLFALESDGSVLWKQCWAGGNADAVVDDLDGDGDLEAIFASDSGFLSVLDARTGAPQWTFDATEHGITPASIPVAPTVADLDAAGPKEVLFTARHAPREDPGAYETFHMALFAVRQNATTWQPELVWMRQPEWAHPLSYTRLVVADVDDDGRADIFGMDWNTIGHRPGEWEVLGQPHAFRLAADGSDVWVRPMATWWSNKQILVGDHDGDGAPDVLVNGPSGGQDGLWRLDARTGDVQGFLSAAGWKLVRGPTAAPVGDELHLVVPVEPEGSQEGRVLVYAMGVPPGGG